MHRPLGALALLLVTLGLPTAAIADETVAEVARPTPVGAFDGHILWSEYDPVANAYFLTQRFQGTTARLPLRARTVPFDVDVGRNAGNDTVAAYSRCSQDPGPRDEIGNAFTLMPQWSTGRGCDLYVLNLRTNAETRVAGASSARASEFLPTVWGGRIAFARVYDHRRGSAGKRTYLFLHSLGGSGKTRRVPAGPRSRGRICAFSPPPCRRVIEPGPTALDLSRRALAFSWDTTWQGLPSSELYVERLRPGRISRLRVTRGVSGDQQHRELIAPQIDATNGLVWVASLSGEVTFSEVRRYAIRTGQRSRARLQLAAPATIFRTVIAGALDGSTLLYLASGLVPLDEMPCTLPFGCIADPGCSQAQPCLLRAAPGLKFKRHARR